MKYIIFSFLILFVSCKSENTQNTFQSVLDSLFSTEFLPDAPGASIIVLKNQEIKYLGNFGVADIDTKEKINENTAFNIASVSKTFVSYGILILQERGELSLDDSLSMYFDDFDNKEISGKIRIKHLLTHTSGLPDLRNVSENIEFYLTAKDSANFEPLKHTYALNFQPGERHEYSNPSYNGLALIIEKVTKQPWQRFIEENIFLPSGMVDSKITNGSYPDSGVAHGYILEDGIYVENDYGEYPTFAASGNSGVWSSTSDLARYENAISESKFLSKRLIEESRRAFVPENWTDTIPSSKGYSWYIFDKEAAEKNFKVKEEIIYHYGDQGGFNAFYFSIPERNILYVGLFNRPFGKTSEKIEMVFEIMKKYKWLE